MNPNPRKFSANFKFANVSSGILGVLVVLWHHTDNLNLYYSYMHSTQFNSMVDWNTPFKKMLLQLNSWELWTVSNNLDYIMFLTSSMVSAHLTSPIISPEHPDLILITPDQVVRIFSYKP